MNVRSKFEVGERPWMMWENKAVQCMVTSIRIAVYSKTKVDIVYKIIVDSTHQEATEKMLFKSKRMLLRSL